MEKSISLIIPAYNEEKNVEAVLENYAAYLKKNFSSYELIAVCNNCSDKTPEIVNGFSQKEKAVLALNIQGKVGKGGAVIEGFKKASNELIGFVDCDKSTSPAEFHKIAGAIGDGVDVAIGSRTLKKSSILVPQPVHRRFLGQAFSFLVNVLFGLDISDTQCGAKLFKKEVVKSILGDLKLNGFEFDVEMLWKAKKAGYTISEVPIVRVNESDSKVSPFSSIGMLAGLLKLRFLH